MTVEIKFCGMTRGEDAAFAASLGAAYVGVIFAGGPRHCTLAQAAEVLADVPRSVRRAGVFADQTTAEIIAIADELLLDVIQLHGSTNAARVEAIRAEFGGAIWPVLRVRNGVLPDNAPELFDTSDGLLLDAYVDGALGGTGVALPWKLLSPSVSELRQVGDGAIVLAGGLTADNVASAVAALTPDVVDVSSGVESAPGIKDHDKMRAFRDAVLHASILI